MVADIEKAPRMALVDYSDSDDSEAEVFPALESSAKPSKVSFQKVVDRTNPGKIRVSLPQSVVKDFKHEDEHPAKRLRTGDGGLGDFKSFLPPPKRSGQTSGFPQERASVQRKTSVTSRVDLKTGAAPGFSRELATLPGSTDIHLIDFDAGNELGIDGEESHLAPANDLDKSSEKLVDEVKLVGKPLMFKPLSVTRNPVKKKKKSSELFTASSTTSGTPSMPFSETRANLPARTGKVSLFSMSSEPSYSTLSTTVGEYEPLIYGKTIEEEQDGELSVMDADLTHNGRIHSSQAGRPADFAPLSGAQSLHEIASDLNLTAADRRQLFGRQKSGSAPQAMKVINFNTDEEYRNNEQLRAAGEQVAHNPVRAIAPGKHSLKQLVNAAANQKEALEESFAKGKSNRAEAGSRYGW